MGERDLIYRDRRFQTKIIIGARSRGMLPGESRA